jgi:hypothetical protein
MKYFSDYSNNILPPNVFQITRDVAAEWLASLRRIRYTWFQISAWTLAITTDFLFFLSPSSKILG